MIRIYHVHIWCWYVMFTYDFDTFSSMFTYGFNMLCSHIMFIYDSDMWENLCWYVMFICKHHKRWSYVNKIMLVYDYSSIHMWTSYVSIISQQRTNMYMIILQFICEHHIPTSYTNNLHDENDVHIWFWVMFTYDFKWCLYMIFRIWRSYVMCTYEDFFPVYDFPYMMLTYDLARLSYACKHMIICVKSYVICLHAYDVHIWVNTHMMFICEHFFRWDEVDNNNLWFLCSFANVFSVSGCVQ